MSYILTLWLAFSGDVHQAAVFVSSAADCEPAAVMLAERSEAELIAFHCVLEIGV